MRTYRWVSASLSCTKPSIHPWSNYRCTHADTRRWALGQRPRLASLTAVFVAAMAPSLITDTDSGQVQLYLPWDSFLLVPQKTEWREKGEFCKVTKQGHTDESRTPYVTVSWWRHQTETFSALLAICAGNSPVPGEFPTQRPVTRSFDVFYDLRLNNRLSTQSWDWWFETLSCTLWRHCNIHRL